MTIGEGRRRPKRLSAETKWDIYLQVTGGAITQADAARKWGVELGLSGPVPARVPAEVKELVLKTVDDAVAAGLSHRWAAGVWQVSDDRVRRWRARRRELGTLSDLAPGGAAVHGLLGWEIEEILAVAEEWGPTDRSHRKLAHRGSHEGRVWVATLVSTEETSTQVRVVFDQALAAQGLDELLTDERLDLDPDDPDRPILLAVSDNGPAMTSRDTRVWMAMMAIAQHHGRPRTPTDQAWIESFFGHIKHEWPHLLDIADPELLETELARVRIDYNTVRLHHGIGYVTPDDEHRHRGEAIREARRQGLQQARSRRLEHNRRNTNKPEETP